jgi:hypothetical protein
VAAQLVASRVVLSSTGLVRDYFVLEHDGVVSGVTYEPHSPVARLHSSAMQIEAVCYSVTSHMIYQTIQGHV